MNRTIVGSIDQRLADLDADRRRLEHARTILAGADTTAVVQPPPARTTGLVRHEAPRAPARTAAPAHRPSRPDTGRDTTGGKTGAEIAEPPAGPGEMPPVPRDIVPDIRCDSTIYLGTTERCELPATHAGRHQLHLDDIGGRRTVTWQDGEGGHPTNIDIVRPDRIKRDLDRFRAERDHAQVPA